MNGWDLFTWIMIVVLAGGACIIFVFFLKDLGGVLQGQRGDRERRPGDGGAR